MTKALDPEIKAMRAIHRALRLLDVEAKLRVSTWLRTRVADELNQAFRENRKNK